MVLNKFFCKFNQALLRKQKSLVVPYTQNICHLLELFESAFLISGFRKGRVDGLLQVKVYLKYHKSGDPVLSQILNISKPSNYIYKKANQKFPDWEINASYLMSNSGGLSLVNLPAKVDKHHGKILAKLI